MLKGHKCRAQVMHRGRLAAPSDSASEMAWKVSWCSAAVIHERHAAGRRPARPQIQSARLSKLSSLRMTSTSHASPASMKSIPNLWHTICTFPRFL